MANDIEEIRSRERVLITAMLNADLATLEEIVAPQFVYTASELGRRSRQEWLDGIPSYRLDVLEIIDMSIERFTEVAIVHGRIRQDAIIHGHHRIGHFLVTDLWLKRDQTWQLVSRTSVAGE
jgi:hypothetical protein